MISDKDKTKIIKELGKQTVDGMASLTEADLREAVVASGHAIKTAKAELEANPKYQQVKELVNDLRAGMSAVKKRQGAIIQYALHLLEEKGK